MRQALLYHFIRILIHRPAICATLGSKAASSINAVASSSKDIIRIVQLLEERGKSFSFCLNKNELLLSCGFGLLFQGVDLSPKGKPIQDSRRLICSVLKMLERNRSSCAGHFKEIACAMLTMVQSPKTPGSLTLEARSPKKPEGRMPAPSKLMKSSRKQLQIIACRFSSIREREATGNDQPNRSIPISSSDIVNPASYGGNHNPNQMNIPPAISDIAVHRRYSDAVDHVAFPCHLGSSNGPDTDYLSFSHSYPASNLPGGLSEKLLTKHGSDGVHGHGQTQPLQSPFEISGSSDTFSAYVSPSPSLGPPENLLEMWRLYSEPNSHTASTQSVVNFSEDEGASGEEWSSSSLGGRLGGITMPTVDGFCMPNRFGL